MEPYHILIADNHVMFREALSATINATAGLKVVGCVGDGLELMTALQKSVPDLIILDPTIPLLSGLAVTKEIKNTHPQVKILILTMHKSLNFLKLSLSVGVNGYLLKEDALTNLIAAISSIREGEEYFSPQILNLMTKYLLHQEPEKILTAREVRVLSLISQFKSDEDIAEDLCISRLTLKRYISNIRKKLNIKKRPYLIKYGREAGLSVRL